MLMVLGGSIHHIFYLSTREKAFGTGFDASLFHRGFVEVFSGSG